MKKELDLSFGGAYDVIVVGAGTAGVFAAISAARRGAKTLLVEKNALPGGTITAAGVDLPGLFHAWRKQIIDGPCYEAIRRAEAMGGAVIPEIVERPQAHWMMQIRINAFAFVSVCEEMLAESGVTVLYHATPIWAACGKDGVQLGIAGKGERLCFSAVVLIDATGDADLTTMCGFATERSETLQPATLIQDIAGYDLDKIDAGKVAELYAAALANGTLAEGDLQYNDPMKAFLDGRISMHIGGYDASTLAGKTALELAARAVLKRILLFLRTVPGGEGVYVRHFAPECGVRESRRIVGEGRISAEDYLCGYVYPDAVAYCFYPVDLHEKVGVHQIHLQPGIVPTIPYTSLIPKGADRLLAAGRCAAGDTQANSAYRVQAACMAMGQAAGVAAAIAARTGVSVRQVPLDALRRELRAIGAIVPQ